jgi:hypothetical protein
MTETKELITIEQNGSVGSITITIATGSICKISFQSVVYEATDLFCALMLLRAKLEESHRLIACNGARRDVFPSGMAREMSCGRKAYILKPGVRPKREDLIDIFDRADADVIASVNEQKIYFERWVKSFGV